MPLGLQFSGYVHCIHGAQTSISVWGLVDPKRGKIEQPGQQLQGQKASELFLLLSPSGSQDSCLSGTRPSIFTSWAPPGHVYWSFGWALYF